MLVVKEKLKEKLEYLSENDASKILDFVEFIISKKHRNEKEEKEICFGIGHLGEVTGELNREDLYSDR